MATVGSVVVYSLTIVGKCSFAHVPGEMGDDGGVIGGYPYPATVGVVGVWNTGAPSPGVAL
jgi:hypothetical protein